MFCFPYLEIRWNIDEVHPEQQDVLRKPSALMPLWITIMLEAQKILHLSQKNNQATKEHRKKMDIMQAYIFCLCLYEHVKYIFIFTPVNTFW